MIRVFLFPDLLSCDTGSLCIFSNLLYYFIQKGFMRALFFIFIFNCLSFGELLSQASAQLNIRIHDTINEGKYHKLENGFECAYLPVEPGDFRINEDSTVEALKGVDIIAVDLVYTSFPEGEDHSELNRRRAIELFMLLPKAFNRNYIQWRIIKQTDCKKAADLRKFRHGFYIYYRPVSSYSDECIEIQSVLFGSKKMSDSTIFKVFKRNHDWKDMTAVIDVTGSMSPYTAQMLLWLKLNSSLRSVKQFVFFNDNEENSHDQSVNSDTVGIWSVESFQFSKVLKTCYRAMSKGLHIENNLEAIFYAVKKFPNEKKKIVMIADNWEDPCDLRLLPKLKELKVPVKIVICGIDRMINTSYLQIALETGGSIHTMEEDIVDLTKIGEGKTLKIGNYKFLLRGGRFTQLN